MKQTLDLDRMGLAPMDPLEITQIEGGFILLGGVGATGGAIIGVLGDLVHGLWDGFKQGLTD